MINNYKRPFDWLHDELPIEDTISDILLRPSAEELQRVIDNEILCSLYVSIGWFKINISNNKKLIHEWCEQNTKNGYHVLDDCVVFMNEKDASWFALKWS